MVLLLWIIFCYLCFVFALCSCLFNAALWSLAGKGLTSWSKMFSCVLLPFPCGVLGQVWFLIVSIPDLCLTRWGRTISSILIEELL